MRDADPSSSIAAILSRSDVPYRDPRELLEDELVVTRLRLQVVRDCYARSRAEVAWPSDMLALEALIRGRIRISDRARDVPIAHLHASFHLTATEERVLWMLIAHELCPLARALVREINTEQVSDPTTDAIRRTVYGSRQGEHASWRELAEEGPLRRLGLVERTDPTAAAPLYRQTWKVSDRVLGLVHGDVALDPALRKLAARPLPSTRLDELEIAGDAAEQLADACSRDGIVIAYGPNGSGRRSVLAAILQQRGASVLCIEGRAISKDRDVAWRELRGLARECALLGLTPLVCDLEALDANGEVPDRIDLVETELAGLVVATARRPIARHWRRVTAMVELPSVSGIQRAALWRRAIPAASAEQADSLATMYPLAPALIHAAGTLAVRQCGEQPLDAHHIASGLRSILDDRLAGLATRVTVTQTWGDLVLPADQVTAIVELMARIRERRLVYEQWGFAAKVGRALGVSALFSGPPGTGKTMAAGLIARDLGVELYRVDLTKIISKWIGETEKNLAALFDAAEAGHAIVLFDEADALFSKRTEVKSSNDRYANQEINFLLQRLESFTGIVILTTNHEAAIDEAFRRRLSIHVQFPVPEVDERLRLWQALLPALAPTKGDLRLGSLAEGFEMSGGYIRNAVVRAAFLAAAEQQPIDASHLTHAAELEYEAMGKLAAKV